MTRHYEPLLTIIVYFCSVCAFFEHTGLGNAWRAQVFLLFHEAWRQDVDPLPEHRVPSPKYADDDGEARNDE